VDNQTVQAHNWELPAVWPKEALHTREMRSSDSSITTCHPSNRAAIELRPKMHDGSCVAECRWIGSPEAAVAMTHDGLASLGYSEPPQVIDIFPWRMEMVSTSPLYTWYIRSR
jgi:hypothetical protein